VLGKLLEKKSESLSRKSGERLARSSNLKTARAMKQSEREGASGSQNLWSMSRAEPGTIFLKSDIAGSMQRIFDAPLAANQGEEAHGRGLERREGGEQIHDVLGRFAGLANGDGPGKLSNVCHSWL
jgi:hypothetical protein